MNRLFALSAAIAWALPSSVSAAVYFHDWTAAPTIGNQPPAYSNVSAAGTITGSSTVPGFGPAAGTWGLPTAITAQPPLTTGFSISGTAGLDTFVEFVFSGGYDWGTGGELIIGNIHNFFEYEVSAWDFNNNPIDVNLWPILAEYDSASPGTLGYFSTTTTDRWDNGFSSRFFVYDLLGDANGGQGGVVHLGGLLNVARLRLTLTASDLEPNAQSGDFILFNVGTPTPEPSTAILGAAGLGVLALAARRRRALAKP